MTLQIPSAKKGGSSILVIVLSIGCTVLFTSCLLGTIFVNFPLTMGVLRSNILNGIMDTHIMRKLPGRCNLGDGLWVHDERSIRTLYDHKNCPFITASQNCEANGRPDRGFLGWRWQPHECELPRFDARAFLGLLRGKTLAFVGDSLARNQMESLMCMLWEVEEPVNKGSKKVHKWWFRSGRVTIIRLWSAWLVNFTDAEFLYAPSGLTKLQLEVPDQAYVNLLPTVDVMVISGGHWFVKRAAFLLNDTIVGAQLWSHPNMSGHLLSPADAFAIAMQTAMSTLVSHNMFKGLAILRTYSPDHYEGGRWNMGGSCMGKTQPLSADKLVTNPMTELMHNHQLHAFANAKQNVTNGCKLGLLDITPAFNLRADAHPGPYRSPDQPDGRPPAQDCLHWCMPGPVDIWNELLLKVLQEELR